MGEKIKELRMEAGLTQEQLAERCGLSRATINAIENGKYDSVIVKTLAKIADALGVTLNIFLE